MTLLSVATKDGNFQVPPDMKGGPVEPEQVIVNIEASAKFDFPVMLKQQAREGKMVFVAGGPTLLDHLDEVREHIKSGSYVVTSNNTHDFLIEQGIVPSACLILDPKEQVKNYVKKFHPDVQYFLSTVCHEETFKAFQAAGVKVQKVMLAYGLDDERDIKTQQKWYPQIAKYNYLVGGTMTPLRAMPFACLRGFKQLEFFGFDSCFSTKTPPTIWDDEPGYKEAVQRAGGAYYEDAETHRKYAIDEPPEGGFFYAYKKPRAENIEVALMADGRRFLTSPGFAHQAKQIIKWYERMEGKLQITFHGDNLTSYLVKLHLAAKEKAEGAIGNRRWTEEYEKQQLALHNQGGYGLWGDLRATLEPAARAICFVQGKLEKELTVLDYGCGNGIFADKIEWMFRNCRVTRYDPFYPGYRSNPEPDSLHDISVCMDVMEHVEPQCVKNVLKWISDRTKYIAVFEIDLNDAMKNLPDGRNAHINQKSAQWWVATLQEFFMVGEVAATTTGIVIACQKPDARELMEKERKPNGTE